MPELPEVETTKQSLTPILGREVNKIEVFQPKLRWPVPDNLSCLKGYMLNHVSRRAKYLILEFIDCGVGGHDNAPHHNKAVIPTNTPNKTLALIIHLGMSGSLQQYPAGFKKRKHDHLIFHMNASDKTSADPIQLHYHDPRRFGSVLWYHDYADKLFNHLGVEPLEDSFTGEYLYKRIHRVRLKSDSTATENRSVSNEIASTPRPITRPIKAVIMDQAFVVGVGNIYATESLFLAGIHPSTPANLLSLEQLTILAEHIKTILKQAIKQGGSTLRDFTVASGTTGYFQQTLNVYGKYKEPCPHCATNIDKVTITGRASTFCPACQPLVTNKSV